VAVKAGSALSTLPDTYSAAHDCVKRAVDELEGQEPELGLFFYSPHHQDSLDKAIARITEELGRAVLIGCTTEAVIGDSQEIEDGPGLAMWVANFGGASVEGFRVDLEDTADGQALVGFPLIGSDAGGVLLLADPMTFPTQALLAGLNADYPKLPIVGGMASGGFGDLGHTLVFNGEVKRSGAVGVVIGRDANMQPVVSQGCTPVGEPYVVTAADRNVILELGGKAPLQRLRDIVVKLPRDEQTLLQGTPPMLGLLIDEYNETPAQGDFLVRNVVQVHLESGAMAVGDVVEVGQTVQFHLRDADAASRELSSLLSSKVSPHARAAVMFVCNGRGSGLFGAPNHDITTVENELGGIPAAGMFCAGEIGPIGGRNFVHGYTASIAVFGS
jgi:small ligand-binding sensory domain FIST